MECPNCQNDEDFVQDREGYTCLRCGAVPDLRLIVDTVAPTYYGDDGVPTDVGPVRKPSPVRSSHYHRPYHLREQLSQWLGTGPGALPWIVSAVSRLLPNSKHLDSERIKSACRSIGARKFAERWHDVRRKILISRGQPVTIAYPSENQLRGILSDFDRVSNAFDRRLYAHGSRRTRKDSYFGNAGPLARHNLPNYHLVIHHLFIRQGIRRRVDAHFYFPLLKSQKVLAKLHKMWEIICEELNWRVTPLTVLTNPEYTHDQAYRA